MQQRKDINLLLGKHARFIFNSVRFVVHSVHFLGVKFYAYTIHINLFFILSHSFLSPLSPSLDKKELLLFFLLSVFSFFQNLSFSYKRNIFKLVCVCNLSHLIMVPRCIHTLFFFNILNSTITFRGKTWWRFIEKTQQKVIWVILSRKQKIREILSCEIHFWGLTSMFSKSFICAMINLGRNEPTFLF